MSEEKAEYKTKKTEAKKPKKEFKGNVLVDFEIDGKRYLTGAKYSTKDQHRYTKLKTTNKIK